MSARLFSFLFQAKDSSTPIEPPSESRLGLYTLSLFYFFAALIVGHHLYSTFFPSSINWGFHHLAFFGMVVKVVWMVLALTILVPTTRRYLLQFAEKAIKKISGLPKYFLLSGLTLGWATLSWVGRTHWYLSGDGALILRNFDRALKAGDIHAVMKNPRLTRIIDWELYRLLNSVTTASFEMVFWLIGLVAGLAFLFLLLLFLRRLGVATTDKFLLGALILFSASSLLFFGYVEDYPLFYVTTFSYLVFSYLFLVGRGHFLLPTGAFALMLALHLSAFFFLPSYLLLVYLEIRNKGWKRLPHMAAALGGGFLLLYLGGYTPLRLVRSVVGSTGHFFPLFHLENPDQNYPIFSWQYLTELFNLQMLVAPFGILLGVLFVLPALRNGNWRQPPLLFLIVAALCGYCFLLVTDADIGLSRDWDIFSTFFLPALFFVVVFYGTQLQFPQKRELLFVAVMLTGLHTAPWVAQNADEEKSLARHRVLYDDRLWGRRARTYYLEELAIYYRDRGADKEALRLLEHYLNLDPNSGRIYHSVAYLYERMGNREKMMESLETSVRLGWYHEEVVSALIALCRQGRDRNQYPHLPLIGSRESPKLAEMYHDLGVYYYEGGSNCGKSVEYFEKAIALDSTLATAYKGAVLSSLCLKEKIKARLFYDKLQQLRPNDPNLSYLEKLLR